ncbi:barstar family protein, partial [Streptomyces sp. NPDC053705]|uniref:barstar family protein n=1 Tax=Streptomyces sp. NPDC053705 TaxID=3156668 RepID=UPI003428465D
MTVTYVIEGSGVTGLDSFWDVMGEAVNGPGGYFGRSLDAFADCLGGGFGTPEDGAFVIEWRDHARSARALGHEETARRLEGLLPHQTYSPRKVDPTATHTSPMIPCAVRRTGSD